MSALPCSYKRHRFPREIIGHAVWLYFRFPLSFRLIEEMLLERGIVVSYETIRRWSLKFGAAYARRLHRKSAKRGDIWHLDEARIVIGGSPHWLRRAQSKRARPLAVRALFLRRKYRWLRGQDLNL
ncbi:transposase [Acetobacter nitrogenifigens DSM 23921 = NBRC 105050]|nr:transposase [Acetobacter nitrogenifigens DSM 23921 = NBRC 105050]